MNVQSRFELPLDLGIDAFFDWSERQPQRYELVKGTPRLQPWVKRNHSKIAANVSFLLQRKLDRSRFNVHQGDFAIATGPSTIRYADVLVELDDSPGDARTADRALLIVEILSPSTMAEDLGPKRLEYLEIASLTDYLILAQDERRAWHWKRNAGKAWPEEPAVLQDGIIALAFTDIDLAIVEIYDNLSGLRSGAGAST